MSGIAIPASADRLSIYAPGHAPIHIITYVHICIIRGNILHPS